METGSSHSWNISLEEAKNLQKNLANKVSGRNLPSKIKHIAGFDVSYLKEKNILIAGMVLVDYPSLKFKDRFILTDSIQFPYIPGFLSFREAPVLLKLIEKHFHLADIFIFDGHGVAHPRGLGIASHIGVLTEMPSIGCAKKKLVGNYILPEPDKGTRSDLIYKNEIVGTVLRTRFNVKPVFVSVGHMVNLDQATELILNCTTRYRLPEPTRLAHKIVSEYRKSLIR